jgi:hypothetical protein
VAASVLWRLAGDDGGDPVAAGGPVRAQEGRYPAAVGVVYQDDWQVALLPDRD